MFLGMSISFFGSCQSIFEKIFEFQYVVILLNLGINFALFRNT